MGVSDTARAAPAIAGSDPRELSCLPADGSRIAQNPTSQQAKTSANVAQVESIPLGMIRELFVVSITLALGFGLNSLHAAQLGDDAAVIGEFRCFRAAARTAGECARDLREILGESRT
jgi:hypothetical protein